MYLPINLAIWINNRAHMQTIFIQIKAELGKAYNVAEDAMENVSEVSEAYSTSGQFDFTIKVLFGGQRRCWAIRYGENSINNWSKRYFYIDYFQGVLVQNINEYSYKF